MNVQGPLDYCVRVERQMRGGSHVFLWMQPARTEGEDHHEQHDEDSQEISLYHIYSDSVDRDDEECWFEEDYMEDRYIEDVYASGSEEAGMEESLSQPEQLLRRSCTIIYVAYWNDPVMTSVTQTNYTASFTFFIVIIITV